MLNPTTPKPRFSHSAARAIAPILGLMIGLASGMHSSPVRAASPENAPSQLKNTLAQIDKAANRRDLKTVMQFFGTNFTNTDGLNRLSLEKALTQLWQRYPKLNYRTELQSWEQQGKGIVAQTVTYINGTQSLNGKNIKLESTLRSRQRFEGTKIIQQEILAERSQLTTGAKPPTVEMTLPEQVRPGEQYIFDAVVKEPLGNDLLLGTALEEAVQAELLLNPKPLDLDVLPSGGIFRTGKAPQQKGNYWVSAVLIRADGMTLITQRLQVSDK